MIKKVLKMIGLIIIVIIALFVIIILIQRGMNKQKYKIDTTNGIEETTYVDINGTRQYIQIRGENQSNPVIIFVHGGPASPMSYVSTHYQAGLEDEYTIINYDQRGCGRTYYANDESMDGVTLDQLVLDLDTLVDYARERFGQEKVIIMGHSWGTILGTLYIKEHPQKVLAYVGVSQVYDLYQGKISIAKQAKEIAQTKDEKDAKKLDELISSMEKVNNYDELNLNELIECVSISAKYLASDGEMSSLQQMKVGITSSNMNFTDVKWFVKQMNTQKFFSLEKNLMQSAFFEFKLKEVGSAYDVPIYYIAGEGDYSVAQSEVKGYYETIQAPDKDFVMLKNVGHSIFMDNPKLFVDTVKTLLNRIKK